MSGAGEVGSETPVTAHETDVLGEVIGAYLDAKKPRHVCWFSCGAASAVATKLYLAEHPDENVVVAYTDTGAEHEDNWRFLAECEAWFGVPITILKSSQYEDTWAVWEKTRYLVGPTGARCTAELKKKVRYAFERPDDIQVFGFTADRNEVKRAVRFREQNPGVTLVTPLIERALTKEDCLAILARAGIELPAMYRLGYLNNNCVGCVKGGMGYWNKIRQDFPDVFDRMSKLERNLGHTVIRSGGQAVYLDELDPDRGAYPKEPSLECGLLCETVIEEVSEPGSCDGSEAA